MTQTVVLPDFPIEGGCQCGAVRYTLAAPPLAFYLCHCTECQKQSSSAFGESMPVRREALELRGTTESFARSTDSGRRMECVFCPSCGTRLLHRLLEGGDTVNLKAGTLDDSSWLVPAGHLWTRSRQGWVALPSDTIVHEKQGDMARLRERWREMTGQA